MKIVCIADTHNLHNQLAGKCAVPDGDVLVHAGDFSMIGRFDWVEKFNDYLGTLPHLHKLVIAGNHDITFESAPKQAEAYLTNCTYLFDKEVVIGGIHFYGSPWSPWFNDWAFNLKRGAEIRAKWDLIPDQTDVLITHGPPTGHGDKTIRGDVAGCRDLLEAIRRIKPRYHVFGHIHEGYGITQEGATKCVNASVVSEWYRVENAPIVVEI